MECINLVFFSPVASWPITLTSSMISPAATFPSGCFVARPMEKEPVGALPSSTGDELVITNF